MIVDSSFDLLLTFALSAGIGLLVGLERERSPTAKAGVRTFALIAVLGTAAAVLGTAADSAWPLGAGLLAVAATLIAAHVRDAATLPDDSGTTTVIAALVVFLLGALNSQGHYLVATALGVGMTALLHFKPELEGFSQRMTAQDIRSILQFAVLSALILPLLPDRPLGPYGVLNPFNLWLMVVLVEGVSLVGYLAWRLIPGRRGLLMTGLLGGAVSSTATTLAYARQVRDGAQSPDAALLVILLANAVMLVRVLVIVGIVAPAAIGAALTVLVLAVAGAVPAIVSRWKELKPAGEVTDAGYRNPASLRTSLAFAAVYGLVLMLSAWVSDKAGQAGLYVLAAVSGLTDVDAITLSSLNLLNGGTLALPVAMTAVGIAVAANLSFKAALAAGTGGALLGGPAVRAFVGPLAGLMIGIGALRALA
ncbi:MAG: MgtC/SapB family protein [Burkholderiaceae bacterium]